MSEHPAAKPVREPFFSRGTIVVFAIAVIGLGVYAARLVLGLSRVTNLSDSYPWGIWIAIDVATGVALAAGGFTSSALVHIFGRERYHPLVRPALLTAMLGYTFVVIGLLADLGRYYNVWHPMLPSMWQGNSVLFEVGICVMIYLTVLYIEFVPILTERFKGRVALPGPLKFLRGPSEFLLRLADATLGRVMTVFIIAGVVLSCLHQSSLGTLMLIAPTKMHPLWFTPVMPAFFLMSAISVGFPMIIFEALIAARSFKRVPEMSLLSGLAGVVPVFLGIYGLAKIVDVTLREGWHYVWDGSTQGISFAVEVGLGILLPVVLLAMPRIRASALGLFIASSLVIGGVALNRINVFLVAYTPPFGRVRYVPTFYEILLTAGLIATLVLVYRTILLIFPVMADLPRRADGVRVTAPASKEAPALAVESK